MLACTPFLYFFFYRASVSEVIPVSSCHIPETGSRQDEQITGGGVKITDTAVTGCQRRHHHV